MAAKTRLDMAEQVSLNLNRDEFGVPHHMIDTWLEWSHQRIADLHTFEEMRTRIYDPVIADCEAAWDAESNVTSTADSTTLKRGTYSAKHVISDGFTTGLASTEAITSTDFSDYTHVKFWIRSSIDTSSGDLQILLDDTIACASPLELLDIGALTADSWSEQTLKLSAPSSASAVISVGLKVITDSGVQTVYMDEIRKVRATAKDVARYSPPTDNKNILSITIQDGASSVKLNAIYHRLYDTLRPRLRQSPSNTPANYIDYGSYFEIDPLPNKAYPMFIRYSKYPLAFSETSLVIEDCEDAWVAKANVTSTADTVYVKKGEKSAKHIIADGHTTGLASTEDFSAVDLSSYTHLKFWIRSSIGNSEGDLRMNLDDSGACASPLEKLNIGDLVADTWSEQILKLADPSALTAILSVGLEVVIDNGVQDVYIDDVRVVSTTASELLRKDMIIEAGATMYGFQFLRQHDEATKWNIIFLQMMKQAAGTDKSHEDLTQVALPFGGGIGMVPAGNPWQYPDWGR